MKDQNYYNTFIEVSEDCPVKLAEVPISKGAEKSIPVLQYELIKENPYTYTQEDLLFNVFAIRNNIKKNELKNERLKFFSKGQPCMRCSPLGKRYGWGIHCDKNGKVAIFSVESKEYKKLVNDKTIIHLKAMRSKRA